jgi:hypothetical protein
MSNRIMLIISLFFNLQGMKTKLQLPNFYVILSSHRTKYTFQDSQEDLTFLDYFFLFTNFKFQFSMIFRDFFGNF